MALNPDHLTLEQLQARYPHPVVDFVLTAGCDATFCAERDLHRVEVLTPEGPDLEVECTLEAVTAYATAVAAAGYGLQLTIAPQRVAA